MQKCDFAIGFAVKSAVVFYDCLNNIYKFIYEDAVFDALGNPVKIYLTSDNVNDCTIAVEVLLGATLSGSIMMGDSVYGAAEISGYIESRARNSLIATRLIASELGTVG